MKTRTMTPMLGAVLLSPAFLTMAGCAGDPSGPTPGDLPASCTGPISPGPSPVRRLTQTEYNNTVFTLLGDQTYPANEFAPDEEANGFTNQASALVVSPLLAEQYMTAAETLARAHAGGLLTRDLPACAGASVDASACNAAAETFVSNFGKKAFRRPLTDDEVQLHADLFVQGTTLGAGSYDPGIGVELVIQAMLQSPHFLYRVESGRPESVEGDIVEMTSYEMASRLSYLFWGTMPDAALFEAADRDELRTPDQIEAQARRMLAAPRAREAVKSFHRQWLGLDEIVTVAATGKDRTVYPDYRESMLPLLQQETERFLDHAIFEADASVQDLYTAPYSIMNGELAEFYGIQGVPAGAGFQRVELDPAKYAGFLTQAGLLALHAKSDGSSPVHRGKFVRERLLCQTPPPPPDVVPPPPTVDPTKTTREQYAQHEEDPGCASCHQWMDPLGFGFEHFDALGRYRETQSGLAIDATGEIGLIDEPGIEGPFDGVVELADRLAQSSRVRECVSKQWFRYAYGRTETEADTCSMDLVNLRFSESEYDIKELLVALTQTDAFRYRQRIQTEEGQ
jgi:Protein of unknown function (DUF1592)/Protein of unknown function (DUF1588)/Protein of unknown function (DUF1587)/Protein of unknown function (DUF1595)/Protein of unknown function (DUF1585)